ncbi:Eukaryotic aspartyl protease family protein [Euphorbia peplus]|nr:Eukaryotic aspartyl protease family protein [Euphorbia peplus]
MPHSLLLLSSFGAFLIIFLSFLPFSTPKPHKDGFKFQLIHRDSPQSPFYEHLTHFQRLARLAEFSNMRANSFQLDVANPQKLEVARNSVSYLVKSTVGTPSIPLYFILDTGSGLTWTQCEPCICKFRQAPPIFNSTMSHTFIELPCQHPFCRDNHLNFRCVRGKCVYRIQYLLGDVTEGVVASDVFQSLGNTHIPLNFGCSKNSGNFRYLEDTGRSGGIMGLSMSPVSILQQLSNITQHRFSYCLVPYDEIRNTPSSSLRFGNEINTHGRTFKSTPIISPPNMYRYFLDLQDISVDHNRLSYPPNTFELKHNGSGGCLIDSGTSLTHIAEHAYPRLKTAFLNHFQKKGFKQIHFPKYDLCYETSGSMDELPTMTFHFQGSDLEVEKRNMIVTFNHPRAFCVVIISSTVTLIGSIQQGNTRFIYDVASRQLLFSPENCLLDR